MNRWEFNIKCRQAWRQIRICIWFLSDNVLELYRNKSVFVFVFDWKWCFSWPQPWMPAHFHLTNPVHTSKVTIRRQSTIETNLRMQLRGPNHRQISFHILNDIINLTLKFIVILINQSIVIILQKRVPFVIILATLNAESHLSRRFRSKNSLHRQSVYNFRAQWTGIMRHRDIYKVNKKSQVVNPSHIIVDNGTNSLIDKYNHYVNSYCDNISHISFLTHNTNCLAICPSTANNQIV